jgi:hypothetical protein
MRRDGAHSPTTLDVLDSIRLQRPDCKTIGITAAGPERRPRTLYWQETTFGDN